MSNYTKSVDFAVKDGLSSGNPAKLIKGTELDAEYVSIASAITSKADANNAILTGTTTVAALTLSGTFSGTISGGTY